MEDINPYRAVPENEIYSLQAFQATRHFPEIATGINNILINSSCKNVPFKKMPGGRSVQKSSSRILGQFCRSSIDEFTAVKEFHHTLIENRLKKKSISTYGSEENLSQTPGSSIYGGTINSSSNTPLFTANEKLMKVAIKYDSSHRGSDDIKGFVGMMMTIEEFNKQLNRGLHIFLNKAELEALFSIMKKTDGYDGEELLDPEAFLTYFFQAGYRARQMHRQNALRSKRNANEIGSFCTSGSRSSEELDGADFLLVDSTDADLDSAMDKLRLASTDLDPSDALHQMRLQVFQSRLTPRQFRVQLQRSFAIVLTDAEASAVTRRYSTLTPPHCVDGSYFVHALLALQQEVRQMDKTRMKRLAALRTAAVTDRNQPECVGKVLGR